jgi:diguanylate cyclase (GGDEF)-like protein/PAS domain S-box-containing protein
LVKDLDASIERLRVVDNSGAGAEAWFSSVLSASKGVVIIAVDANNIITLFSPGAENILGYKAFELIGKKAPDFFVIGSFDHLAEDSNPDGGKKDSLSDFGILAQILAGQSHKIHLRKKDGGLALVELTISPVKGSDRNLAGYAAVGLCLEKPIPCESGFDNLLNNLGVGVYRSSADSKGRFLNVNPAFARMFGFSEPAGIMGHSIVSFYHSPQDREIFLATLKKYGRVEDYVLRLKTKDGVAFYASCTASLERQGSLQWIDGALMDITSRCLTEKALEDSEERFRCLSENVPDIIYTLNTDGSFSYVNPAWKKVLGHETEEVLGRHFSDFSKPGQADRFKKIFERISKEALTVHVNCTLRHKDGHDRILDLSGAPNLDSQGRLLGVVGMLKDITLREEALQLLQKSQADLARAQKMAGLATWELDLERETFQCSEGVFKIYGVKNPGRPFTTEDFLKSVHPGDRKKVEQVLKGLTELTDGISLEHRIIKPDGSEGVVSQVAELIQGPNNEPRALAGAVQDITELKKSEQRTRLLARVVENTIEGIMVTDEKASIVLVNQAFTAITGYEAKQVVGANPRILSSGRHPGDYYQRMWRSLLKEGYWQGEIWNKRKDATLYPAWLTITAVKDHKDRVSHYVGVFHDITEVKRNERKIAFQAYHDALTGLPNRLLFHDRLQMAIAHANRKGLHLAVMFLDLDNFKDINDSLGHHVGDLLLEKVARRISRWVRGEDTVARLGGDEFIMLLLGSEKGVQAEKVAQRILHSLAEPFYIKEHELFITGSIGITIYPTDGKDPQTLLSNADLAMYQAKDQGRSTYRLFTREMNQKVMQRVSMEAALRQALEKGEFRVYYQPQVDLETGAMVGAEALLRWKRPGMGILGPDEFIPLAESTGLIVPIGEWVLAQACFQARTWHDQGFKGLLVSVNLSPRQFQQPNLVSQIKSILKQTRLDPACLELEVTESVVMQNVDEAIQIMSRLCKLGVRLSLDDFGRGYSSLYYLKRFPMHTLKIDRSFVRDITLDQAGAAIVNTIIDMSGNLSLKVVAEGVETKEQLNFLRHNRCDQIQGFLFCRPIPQKDLTALMTEGKKLELVLG